MIELGIRGMIQEHREMGLDSIYRQFYVTNTEMYECIKGYSRLQRELQKVLNQMAKLRSYICRYGVLTVITRMFVSAASAMQVRRARFAFLLYVSRGALLYHGQISLLLLFLRQCSTHTWGMSIAIPEFLFALRLDLTILLWSCCALQPYRVRFAA